MGEGNGLLDRVFSVIGAGAAGVAGLVGGGLWYLSAPGAVFGLLMALAIMGGLTIVLTTIGALEDGVPAPATATAYAPTATPSAAYSAAAPAPITGMTAIETTLPPDAPIAAAKIEATETEAQLLAAGRFADYHLAKAKRLYAAKNFKEAAYQAAASLAHGDLAEAHTTRKAALAAAA